MAASDQVALCCPDGVSTFGDTTPQGLAEHDRSLLKGAENGFGRGSNRGFLERLTNSMKRGTAGRRMVTQRGRTPALVSKTCVYRVLTVFSLCAEHGAAKVRVCQQGELGVGKCLVELSGNGPWATEIVNERFLRRAAARIVGIIAGCGSSRWKIAGCCPLPLTR
jgi:hypothetical protein